MIRALGSVASWIESQGPKKMESGSIKLPVRFAEQTGLSEKQVKLLEKMVEEFNQRVNQKYYYREVAKELRIVAYILENPDMELFFEGSQSKDTLFLFDEFVSIKKVTEIVLNRVKLRRRGELKPLSIPKFKTIFNRKDSEDKSSEENFSIKQEDLKKMRHRFTKRPKSHKINNLKNSQFQYKGRVVKYSPVRNCDFAILPTILNSVKNGRYSLQNRKLNIIAQDFLFPCYERNVVYNIMLVLDTSKSISWMIDKIEEIISSITTSAFHSRDKLGLITFKNNYALIHHYPTLNVKQVIGTINNTETKGKTPLGEALKLASSVLSKNQYKMPGMKNIVIMISDCFPEPLEGGYKNLLDEPSYMAVINAAERLKKTKIELVIINPSISKSDDGWNKKLVDKVKKVSNAKYIRIRPQKSSNCISIEDTLRLTETIWSVKEGLQE